MTFGSWVFVATVACAIACGGSEAPANVCVTPARAVSCSEQDFVTFELEGIVGSQPTWLGRQCREHPCAHGDACEVQGSDGVFVEGVCE